MSLPAVRKKSRGGQPGRSGPPGNLNNCKRPWEVFWRRRALRAEDRWILKVLGTYVVGLVADKPDPSNAKVRLMEIAQIARGATMLILNETARGGFIIPAKNGVGWDLHPGAKDLPRFLQVERQALKDLGVERETRDVTPTLDSLLAEAAEDGEDQA